MLTQVTSKMYSYPEHPLLTVDERVRKWEGEFNVGRARITFFNIYAVLHM